MKIVESNGEISDSYSVSTIKSEQNRVYSKIILRLMPLLLVAYILAFLDRINVGYAKLSMQQDLGFSDAVYGLGAGLFFLTYLLFETPSNMLFEKIGARLTFLRIMVLWGLTSAATAFVTEAWQFYVVRLLLGIFEAGFFPGVILYLTYWFPSSRRGRVTGLFMFAMPITGVLGGPISGMLMTNMDGFANWNGWQWLFVIEGIPTVIMGFILYSLLPNNPQSAKWLSHEEKQMVLSNLATGSSNTQVSHTSALKSVLKDPKVYLLAFVYFTCACSVYVFTFWLPTMIQSLGIKSISTIGWLSAIPYVFGTLGVLAITYSSDLTGERRIHVGGGLLIGVLLLYATVFLTHSTWLTITCLSVAAFFIFGSGILFWAIPPTYLSKQLQAVGIAVISSIGILGGFLSPVIIGYIKTLTGSMNTGLLCLVGVVMLGALTVLFLMPKKALVVSEKSE